MRVIQILLFGISREIFGKNSLSIDITEYKDFTVDRLKSLLEKDQPGLKGLGSYLIAVNNEYADPGYLIQEKDEIALIPPVSGG
jgi:molybdopterin synthase sulfur carrier subunit